MNGFSRVSAAIMLAGVCFACFAAWGVQVYNEQRLSNELHYRAHGHALAIRQALDDLHDRSMLFLQQVDHSHAPGNQALQRLRLWLPEISNIHISERNTGPADRSEVLCRQAGNLCALVVRSPEHSLHALVDMAALVERAMAQTPVGGFHVRLEQWRDKAWLPVYLHESRSGDTRSSGLANDVETFASSLGTWRTVNIATPSFAREYGWLAILAAAGTLILFLSLALLLDRQTLLAEQRRHYISGGHAMLDAIDIPVSLIGKDFSYQRINKAFADMYNIGHPRTVEEQSLTVGDVWGREVFERDIRNHLAICMDGTIVEWEFVRTDGDGTARHMASTAFPYYDDGQIEGVVVVSRDITEFKQQQKEREEELRNKARQARLQEIGMLAGGIAHDINNMLAIIVGETELAALAGSFPEQEPHLNQVLETSDRAARLCKHLLTYAGKGKYASEVIHPGELLQNMREMLLVAAGHRINLRTFADAATPPIRGDKGQIEQLLLNLVLNASEAIGKEAGDISIRCAPGDPGEFDWQAAEQIRPEYVTVILVEDNGPGMPPDLLEKIFLPFFTTKAQGSGMGLAAVHGIVSSLGGVMTVDSKLGTGSRFKIALPALQPRIVDSTENARKKLPAHQKAFSGVALLADDEAELLGVGRLALERMGFEVIAVSDGKQALKAFRSNRQKISLVIMDVMMPNMDGVRAAMAIRELSSVPIIFCSGYQCETVTRENFHPDAVIQKPYRFAMLREVIERLLH